MSSEHGVSEEKKSDSELIEEVLEQVAGNEKSEKQIDQPEVDEMVESLDAENKDVEQETKDELLDDLKKQLKQSEKKAEDNWDKAVRAQAEMENLKRRTQKDLESAHKYGLEKFAKELLSVIDSLELGIQASTSDNPEVVALREGSSLTIKQFESVFAKFNIEALDPIGESFNPELHQAMTMQANADAEPNTVLNVFQKGYILNGRLIRPAMVVVSQAVKSVEVQADQSEDKPEDDSINLDEQA